MKLDSKYFDGIRVSKGRGRARTSKPAATEAPTCQWRGCTKPGLHKAPKGRASEGEYYFFCRDHVVEYNKTYDYFAGMKDSEVADFQKSASTGHRPTWSMGVHGHDAPELHAARDAAAVNDPFELLKRVRGREQGRAAADAPKRRAVTKGALKHLQALNLDETATSDDIKIQFKALVKLHHPDHNGGDRSSEDRFREVLASYNYLKQSGLVR